MRRAVIVEDEPLARGHLRMLVSAHAALELVGEAADGAQAVTLIEAQQPDLVFLDIALPALDGWQVLAQLRHQPQLVLTTAFDHHAVQAFELGAVDYLLKPFGQARFDQAVSRVLAHAAATPRLQSSGTPAQATSEPDALAATLARARHVRDALQRQEPLAQVFVREGARVIAVNVSDILRLEADDDYVHVITARQRHLLTMSLGDLLLRLDGGDDRAPRFVRVHRSHAVALRAVASYVAHDAGRWQVQLSNGDRVVTSRSGTRALREALARRAGAAV